MARLSGNTGTEAIEELRQPAVEKCIVCGKREAAGIHICEKYICLGCEQKIVNTEVESEQYKTYVRKLRKILAPK